jgi:hypothetical protein
MYIKKFDPDFDYPERWNVNDKYSAKIDCSIEVDYIHIPRTKMKHSLYRSQSLTNLLEHKEKETMLITCIKFNAFGFRFTTDKWLKIIGLCLSIAFIGIATRCLIISDSN